jgi:predicted ATPase
MRPFPRLLVGSDIRQLQVTPFIGREMELTEIASRLTEPACRLLTLLGVGGSGKTRLALEIMEHKRGAFRDGVYFVPLVAAQTADHLVTAIADTLALSFYNHVDP